MTINYLQNFRLWLESQNLNNNTVRNYVADLNKYLTITPESKVFDQSHINTYLRKISTEKNNQRYLASFNKFCQFAKDQNLIESNPTHQSKELLNLEPTIKQYEQYLFKKNKSPSTIQNYINDVNQFINWLETS